MKRELVTGLLTLSLLASMLPANAAAAGSAPVSGQMVESQTGRESGAADSQLSSEAETGAFSFEDGTYETMEAAFAAASSGGTVTLTGRYGSGEGEKLVKIPANIVLQVASGAALTAELEDAAAILTSEGTLQVQAGGRLEFLGQTYVGTDADSVIRLQEGGITISGGEPTVQWEFALELLKACRQAGINTCVETCMQTKPEILAQFYPLTDYMITDIKNMDTEVHKKWSGVGNEQILANIEQTVKAGVNLTIRIPIIPGVNDSEENIHATGQFIRDRLNNRVSHVQLLTYLKMGTEKYESLGLDYPMGADYQPPAREEREPWIAHLAEILRSYGINAVAGATTKAKAP